jgi:hypothetical protein
VSARSDKNPLPPTLPPGCSPEHWSEAICLSEAYSWRKDIDAWSPFLDASPTPIGEPGDMLAVSARGLIQPRQLVGMGDRARDINTVCVYLGLVAPSEEYGLETMAAVFCDREADPQNPDCLIWKAIPISEVDFVVRVLGTAAINKPFRDLTAWQFAEHERAIVDRFNPQVLLPLALQAFDNGGLNRLPLPVRAKSSDTVH